MSRRSAAMLAAVLIIAIAAGSIVALRGRPSPMTPTPTPGSQIAVSPVPAQQLAPVVIQRSPERGEELRPDGAVTLVFDRAMDQASVAAALQLSPSVAGKLSWPNARTAVFTPNQALPHATQFALALDQGAKSQDGAALSAALELRFQTSGYLEVGQVVPADGAQDVATTDPITVLFNRPVVPLTSVAQMQNLPQPLSFAPAVSGRGAWLNTAIYVFTPDQPLASGTNYKASIAGDLQDALGNPLQAAFSWQFATARPQVVNIDPADAASGVSVAPTLRVQFNGPIDQASVQGITLRAADGSTVPTRAQLLTDTLLLTPTERLGFERSYRIEVPAGSGAVRGGAGLANPFGSSFQTVPLPKIVRTEPADGATGVNPWMDFTIVFNAPIDEATVPANLRVTPAISATEVYSYFDTGSNSFHIGLGQRPSTDFTIEIGPGIADPFGNTTGQTLITRFRTAPLPPSVSIIAPTIATYSSVRPARIALQAVNTTQAKLSLYRLPDNQLEQPIYTFFDQLPGGAQELRRWTAQLNAPADQPTINQIDLLPDGATLDPGMYLVQVESEQNQGQRHVLIVSPINLTLKTSLNDVLVWANDSQSGAPVANLAFDLYEEAEQITKVGSATTGSDGVARLTLTRSDERGLIAVARSPFAAMGSQWAQSISRWEFAAGNEFGAPGAYAYVYTDRPIYRPGQQVHFKGLARSENDARFTTPQGATVAVQISDSTGAKLFDQPLQLGPNGTFNGDLTLDAGAALGDYQIITTLGDRTFVQSFRVAAYRPPEFEVTVTPGQAAAVRGLPIRAAVATRYLFGGPLANAPVTWNVLAAPYQFAPEWANRFQFGDTTNNSRCWECWWQLAPPPEPILSGSGVTDAQGNLQIDIPASALDTWQAGSNQSAQLTIEAVATGRDNQAIAGRSELTVHSAGVYIGLAPQAYLGRATQPLPIDIVAADTSGKALANQAVAIEFQRVTWENTFITENGGGRWESTEQVRPAGTATATTDGAGQATTSFTPTEGGSYRVTATASDGAGRTARTVITTWVTGSDYVPWLRDNSDRITLVADKASYKPGETATVLIPSPFQGAHWALITVERAGIKRYEVRRVESNSIVFQLLLTAEDAPNVYVSAVLFAGGDGTNGRTLADFKTGVLPITVEPTAQMLNVKLTPSQPQAAPGAKLAYDVQVTDATGAGVAAELSLDLVDKGVLNLAPRRANDLAAALFAKRGLGVTTSSALTLSGDRTQEQLAQSGGRGGGGMEAGAAPTTASAPVPAAPMSDAVQKSAAPQAGPAVRENFADTAYWNPTVSTDSNGRGQIELTLPDNLTTWTMRGVALTADTSAGEGQVELVATKPLLVRPVTPRFFTVGDTAVLAANISNNTDAPLAATVALAATGLDVTSPLTQTLQIPARGEAQATWTATAQDVTSADLVFSATAGAYSDASKPRLATGPNGSLAIYRYSAPENVGTGGQLGEAGARGEVIALPPNVDPQNGELTVRLDPSLAAGVRDGLRALEHYEYECAEQTVSRFLPNLLTARALKDLQVPNAELEAKLPGLVADGVTKLASKQNEDGGWGWWPNETSNPQISAYVVFGLAKAKAAGYSVPGDVLQRGQEYVVTQLKATDSANQQASLSTADANQQAFLLFALAESGRADATRIGELFTVRTKLATYARALLAMALHDSGAAAADGRIKALLADLNSSAITSATGTHWEEAERDWWSMNTDTRSTAIALEALVRLDPAGGLAPNVVRWLMAGRRDGAWATTQESAWSLMALTSSMARSGELQGKYEYAALLNGTTLVAGRATPQTIDSGLVAQIKIADMLRDTGNVLTVGRGEGPGQLYYTAQLRSFLPVGAIKALDRGISVQRRYTLASCAAGTACPDIRSVKVGDTLRVELSIIAPSDLHYLIVEDPLPAGVAAIDPALATSSVLDAGPGVRGQGSGAETDALYRPFPWWGWATRTELRDQKVALFADFLPKGAYTFSYTVRATQAGEYRAIPTTASELYFPDVYGRGDGAVLNVDE